MAPSFAKRPLDEFYYGGIGGNVTIVCEPEVAPFPEFSWLRNGINLGLTHGDTTSRIRMLQTGFLFIQGLTMADEGVYTCSVTNDLGSDSSTTSLKVGSTTFVVLKNMLDESNITTQ